MTTLWLTNNRISEVSADAFSLATSLSTLLLSQNLLATLPPGLLARPTMLSMLDLSGNMLTSLPLGLFSALAKMSSLYLSDNLISALIPGTFNGLKALSYLTLSNNSVAESACFPQDTFAGLKSTATIKLEASPTVQCCTLSTLPVCTTTTTAATTTTTTTTLSLFSRYCAEAMANRSAVGTHPAFPTSLLFCLPRAASRVFLVAGEDVVFDDTLACAAAHMSVSAAGDLVLCGNHFESNVPVVKVGGNGSCTRNAVRSDASGNLFICSPRKIVFGPGRIVFS
jgi:hypothetical protein